MKTLLLALLAFANAAFGQWIMTTARNPAVRAIAPDVHAVRADEQYVYVESAGLSLHSFGAIEANQYDAPAGIRSFTFRIPRHPKPAGVHQEAPLGITGVFANGVPIYNPVGTVSWRDQNIWHQDAVAASARKDRPPPLAILGFALDGYPIFGQVAKSSYRLRKIARRDTLADGTLLTPAQEGPAVSPEYPLGAFAEDYEYVAGSGDLDEFNGKWSDGVYGYYRTAAWPYLIGPRYYGEARLDAPAKVRVSHSGNVDLWVDREQIEPGEPVHLTLVFNDSHGRPVRFLEKVHTQPVHLIVTSKDLADFDHIHAEPVPQDGLAVSHTFPHPGEYWLYADYTLPGEPPSIARFPIEVEGAPRKPSTLVPDSARTKTVCGVRIDFKAPPRLTAGEDLPLAFALTNPENNQPVADLQPWLGAWGHIMIVGANGENFIHAHPLDSFETTTAHSHAVPSGPSPQEIRTVTGFRSPGIYKLWLQFQRHDELITVPWVIRVEAPAPASRKNKAIPEGAIEVTVDSSGFTPSRIEIPGGKPTRIYFIRTDAQNCAGEIAFPDLGIRKPLPPSEPVAIDVPAFTGELRFACGMGMFRGSAYAFRAVAGDQSAANHVPENALKKPAGQQYIKQSQTPAP